MENRRQKKVNDSGDTIVEVLISITIIGVVLAAAYLLTSRSLQAGIAARERTEALNYAQGQIERLKSVKESTSVADFNTSYHVAAGTSFCLTTDPATRIVSRQSPATKAPCIVDASHPNGDVDARYHLSTTYISTGRNQNTFRFSVDWDRVGTGTPENASIYYRFSQ